MRISDWSSDVCSSDLERNRVLYLANNVVAQSGELTTKGVEFEASYTLPGNFELRANYGYNQLRSEVNSSLDYMPRHIASIWSTKTFGLADEAQLRLGARSEEHTSELQSLMRTSYAVFCLKKKKQHIE